MRLAYTIAALGTLTLGASAGHATTCLPPNILNYVSGCPSRYSTDPADSSYCPVSSELSCGGPSSSYYNLTTGHLHVDVTPCQIDAGSSSAECTDQYAVVGPAGGPMAFNVIFSISVAGTSGQANNSNNTGCSLASMSGLVQLDPQLHGPTTQFSANASACQPNSTSHDIIIPLTKSPGETFELRLGVSVSASELPSTASSTGQLQFTGLPAGYSIISCQGYSSDAATPTRDASWGRLKIRYR